MPRSRSTPVSLALVASLALLGGCTHAKTETQVAGLEQERESEVALLRRENSALRSRVQNLEERVRLIEQGGSLAWSDSGSGSDDSADEWVAPEDPGEAAWAESASTDGPRQLPVVKLEPRRTSNGGKLSAKPAEPSAAEPPTRVLRQTGSISLSPLPNSGAPGYGSEYDPYDDDNEGYGDYADIDVDSDSDSGEGGSAGVAGSSYRLVGSRLVEATKAKPQVETNKRDRDSDVVADYDQAMETYRDGRYADAEAAFEAIVKSHPSHDYADNALYWQGESAYDQAHYADALAAFTTVVERYGGGGKAADALLKIGLCYGRLGDTANARDVLTQLIAAYPRSDASKIAKRKLDELSE